VSLNGLLERDANMCSNSSVDDWRDLGGGLLWRAGAADADVRFGGPAGGARFVRVDDRRHTCALTFRDGAMAVNVSIQPGAIDRVVESHARDRCVDPNRWRVGLVRALKDWSAPTLDHLANDPVSLLPAVVALGHPLLGDALRLGGHPPAEVPRWASPILRTSTPGEGAQILGGARSSRRLARSLAASLTRRTPDDRIDLGPLFLAAVGADTLSADDLCALLDMDTAAWPTDRLPSSDELHRCRQGLALVAASSRRTVLRDAGNLAEPGPFVDTMGALAALGHRLDGPVRGRLEQVTRVCSRYVAGAPTADASRVPEPTARLEGADRVQDDPAQDAAQNDPARRSVQGGRTSRPRPLPARALVAPAAPAACATHWVTPDALRVVDGRTVGDLRFVVARSANELARWGQALGNCLAGFASAVSWGRSWIIAVFRDDVIIGCVEISPNTLRVRQASGAGNRPLPQHTSSAIRRALQAAGITERQPAIGRPEST
jgi:hypothetical protein